MTTTLPEPPPVLALTGMLDGAAATAVRRRLRAIPLAPPFLILECAGVTGLDPVGVALTWLLLQETEDQCGTRIELRHLDPALAQQLRGHPLRDHLGAEDAVFENPFAVAESRR